MPVSYWLLLAFLYLKGNDLFIFFNVFLHISLCYISTRQGDHGSPYFPGFCWSHQYFHLWPTFSLCSIFHQKIMKQFSVIHEFRWSDEAARVNLVLRFTWESLSLSECISPLCNILFSFFFSTCSWQFCIILLFKLCIVPAIS